MAMQKCLYCNTGNLLHVKPSSEFYSSTYNSEGVSSLPLDLYQCDTCGIQCTQLEIEKVSTGPSSFFTARKPEVSEEDLLVQAWKLMRENAWEEALNVLFRAGSPLEHPLDFLICRDICQIAPLLQCDKNDLENRYIKLKMLLNDLSRLDYYITDDGDSDTAFSTLNRLHAALMLLGTLPVKRHVIYAYGAPAYYTNRYRAAALCAFADYLEATARNKEKHGTQYLKMAVQLHHRSLEACKEKEQLLPHRILYLNLPPADRRQINAKIAQLNAEIKRRDPQFNPVPPPPEPKVIAPAMYRILSLIFWFCIYVIVVSLVTAFFINPTHSEQDTRDFLYLDGILLLLGGIFLIFFFSSQPNEIILPKNQGNMTLPQPKTGGTGKEQPRPANPPLTPGKVSLVKQSSAEKNTPPQNTARLKAKAGQQRCIYCGSGTEIVRDKTYAFSGYTIGTDNNGSKIIAVDYYKCPLCGVHISREEAGLAAKGRTTASKSDGLQSEDAETEILQSAWDLMQKNQWDQALKILFRHSYPFKHPLEFMVYRNICLAARLFIYPRTKWQAALLAFRGYDIIILKKRYDILDPFLNTMRDLDYYLPQHDREETFRILSGIYEALSFFADLPFKHYEENYQKDEHPYKIIDYTHAKRMTIISGFADILKSKAGEDPEHDAAYLDMARQLLNKCLTLNLKINGEIHLLSLEAYSNKQSYIYEETRLLFEKQIELFNAWLSQRDPRYLPIKTPGKAVEAPNLMSTAPETSCLHMIISGLFGFVIIPFCCAGLITEITGEPAIGGQCFGLAAALYSSYLYKRSTYKMLLR